MQLDLFSVRAPATIHHFPLARRTNLIRQAVDELMTRDFRRGRSWWNAHMRKLAKDLRTTGMSQAEMEDQLGSYAQLVAAHVRAGIARESYARH